MRLTVSSDNDLVFQLDVDPNEQIDIVKIQIESLFNIPPEQQILLFNGQPLNNSVNTLVQAGVNEDDLILVTRRQVSNNNLHVNPTPSPPVPTTNNTAWPGMTLNDIPGNCSPELFLQIAEKNPQLLQQLEHSNPDLAAALKTKDVSAVRQVLMLFHMKRASQKYQEEKEAMQLNSDPFNAESQAKIEENIRLGNVQQNLEIAMEEMPEAFGNVHMLYIPCEVNNTKVKAFVDSGAQSTIMSSNCAERCGIMRLVDHRFAGQAVGVGTAKIIGRVHMASLKIGDFFYNCSFTILDQQDVDFLFGLDMLKRHQACIDLKKNLLSLENASGAHTVSFLPEHEIPQSGRRRTSSATNAAENSAPTIENRTSGLSEDKVNQLNALGFQENQINQALQATNGNVELAAGMLFESQK